MKREKQKEINCQAMSAAELADALKREMAAGREIAERKRPRPSFPHVFATESIPHPVEEE